jgi:hypothetical protein
MEIATDLAVTPNVYGVAAKHLLPEDEGAPKFI